MYRRVYPQALSACICGLLFAVLVMPASAGGERTFSLIPRPLSVVPGSGEYALTSEATVSAPAVLRGAPDATRLLLAPATGFPFAGAADGEDATLTFLHDGALPEEGYRLQIDGGGVRIHAASNAGAFYALQTLRQLLPARVYAAGMMKGDWPLPHVTIEDAPRFGWRGLHLDVGRHFMPVGFIKKYIDLLAAHKMNRFHWHLTEDQGWRLEIRQYPRLTEVGAMRAQTVVGNTLFSRKEPTYDGKPHGGYYTQEEVREVVAYAAARHVTVVPEIEFPGHAQAAIAAYPELGNTGEQLRVKEEWGISKNTIKPSEETLQFYRNVLSEVMALFPSEYIHIGGDEAPKEQWEQSDYARERMRELGLATTAELQSWLIEQMDAFLRANGRKLIGWDEIMQGGLSANATVMSWRGSRPGIKAALAGHDVIMAPVTHTYFDYYQADPKDEPLAIGSYLPLQRVYAFEPIPRSLPAAQHAHILGAQGQLWTEFMKTPEHVEYMAYPRAVALAEVLWSPAASRDYADFLRRLTQHLDRLDAMQVNYRQPGDDALSIVGRVRQQLLQWAVAVYFWWQDR